MILFFKVQELQDQTNCLISRTALIPAPMSPYMRSSGSWRKFLRTRTVCRRATYGYTQLAYMKIKVKNLFTQPHVTMEEDFVLKHVSPEPVNSRGCLGLSKKD